MSATQSPPATVPVQNWYKAEADTLYAVAVIGGLSFPGALGGALLAGALWHVAREPHNRRVVFAGIGVLTAITLRTIIPGWFWRFALTLVTPRPLPASPDNLMRSMATEVLLGPLLLLTLQLAQRLRSRTALGQVAHEHTQMKNRARAMQLGYTGGNSPGGPSDSANWDHPPGKIRLGTNESRRFFDVDIGEIAHHVFIPGASGSGKTTTLMRIAGGAIANGYGVLIIDCKGVGLALQARRLAQRFDLPFYVVDPDDPDTLGYDPCTGDPAHVANKLIGAFSFSPEAEIYKNIAMEVVPVIVRALAATGQPITLERIYSALAKGGMARLGRAEGAEPFRDRLDLLETSGGVGSAGYLGLQRRFGALLEGKFGDLFSKQPSIDWDPITASPSVTYFSLSATAASEDVELFGRVITQDLKQLCDSRLRALRSGETLTPVLVIYDEFAALREARQIVDLLLQARQAQMPVVVATQYVPEEIPIKTPVLQAGVLICHRVASDDAETIAAEIGTHTAPKLTSQVDFATGESELGSVRPVEEYNIHPNVLRELATGMTAIYARRSNRRQIVRIHPDES